MPSWLSEWVGTDMAPLAYYALVAVILLVLIFVVLAIARKVMGAGGGARVKNRGPRLAVMDVAAIDPKRKLVLVRRDEIEHLLLIGGQNDLVVESSILRVVGNARMPRSEPSMRGEPETDDEAPRPLAAGRDAQARRPAQVAAQPPMPSRAVEPRGASPLSRTIPQPASAAPAVAPQVVRPEPAPIPLVEAVAQPAAVREAPPVVAPEPARPASPPAAEEPRQVERAATAPSVESVPAVAPPVRTALPVAPPTPMQPVVRTRIAASTEEAAPAQPIANAVRSGDVPVEAPRQVRPSVAPVSRVAIGGTEPVRRPLPVQPIQPRSMATPTFPVKSVAPAPVEDVRPTVEPGMPDEPKTAVTSDEALLLRLLKMPAGDIGGRSAGVPEPANGSPAPSPSPSPLASTPAGEVGERRPLSVRSFASAIQTRQSPSDPIAMPPPAVLPAPATAGESPASRNDPERPPVPMPAPAARFAAPAPAAPTTPPVRSDAAAPEEADIEDFLSAQLNSDLNDDIWKADEPVDADTRRQAPPVRAPTPEPAFATPSGVEAARPEGAAKPRALTLEEEMERLLGDFDLETTDRRQR